VHVGESRYQLGLKRGSLLNLRLRRLLVLLVSLTSTGAGVRRLLLCVTGGLSMGRAVWAMSTHLAGSPTTVPGIAPSFLDSGVALAGLATALATLLLRQLEPPGRICESDYNEL